jgi:hypothetical protein
MVARGLMWYESGWICTETKRDTYQHAVIGVGRGAVKTWTNVCLS